ncbi:YciI family protein [Dankookia sp. GCM10030260]|uniref:YciI family protein n=1 Tax=Dankookia sp. GCM10030260 TaxID=3273390 RepID=UPI0036104F6F
MPLFAIVAYDKTDDEAPARRRAARTAHFKRMTNAVKRKLIHFAGSMIADDGTMKCSIVICDFPERAQLDQWISEEPYVMNGAWDRIEVAPLFSAVENGEITQSWLKLMEAHISNS